MSKDMRKGAWTEEEDDLLRQCIFEYGEGRWHLVPSRSGLNRCRKSCRLRWVNYLHPNIRRGVFEEDEIDLIIRLHRLLGNRWSLIARRLPGRTSNDIKNYWNTHLNKKKKEKIIITEASKHVVGIEDRNTNNNLVKTNVIKPRPWTFSKTRPWVWKNRADSHDIHSNDKNTKLVTNTNFDVGDYNQQFLENGDDLSSSNDNWWKSLLYGGEEVVNNDLEECINAHMQHKIVTCVS